MTSTPEDLWLPISHFIWKASFGLIFALSFIPSVSAADISGIARATDGDTLRVGEHRVRLCGIQAPETDTRAGKRSRAAMADLVDGRAVQCTVVGNGTPCDGMSPVTSFERVVAQCFIGGRDIAAEMVRGEWAEGWPRYSGGHYAR